MGIIASHRAILDQLTADSTSSGAAHGGLKHLDYLVTHWMPIAMWQSWSDFGRLAASSVLKISIEGVIPTTNHLESFNAILKRKHLASHLHSGHWLRFDSLIHILIVRILPGIFSHHKAQGEYSKWLTLRFRTHAGGEDLVKARSQMLRDHEVEKKVALCWWDVDEGRDARARQILDQQKLIIFRKDQDSYTGHCSSTSPTPDSDSASLQYDLEICRSGWATCSCADFQSRGGACKHLRSMRFVVEFWISHGHEMAFSYPQSRSDAEKVYAVRQGSGPGSLLISQIENMTPPPAAPNTIQWDPLIIQALGCDPTTIDTSQALEDDTTENSKIIGDDSAACELQVELGGSDSEPDSEIGEGSDSSKTCRHISNSSAIQGQIQSKVNYEVHRLLPSLHGLANLVSNGNLILTQELKELSSVLNTIQLGLDSSSAMVVSKPGPSMDRPVLTIPLLPHGSKRSNRPLLLPPSPERRQKRKNSHAPL